MAKSRHPIHISPKYVGVSMATAQNQTIQSVWKGLKKNGVYFIADAVGRGKSYIALSAAIGLWRSQKSRNSLFRILIISPNQDLSVSWLKKLNGPFVALRNRIGENLASIPGDDSFFDAYFPEMKSRSAPDVVVYRFKGKSCTRNLASDFGEPPNPILRPGRRSKFGRIEILVTTPYWIKTGRGSDPFWRSWLKNAEVVIADEVFSARSEASVYGQILRPNVSRISPWHKRNARPWLVGLSATLLSRDITDTWTLIKMAYGWQNSVFDFKSNDVQELLNQQDFKRFQQALKHGLDPTRGTHQQDLRDYKEAKHDLENRLRTLLVRTPNRPHRIYQFWPVGQAGPGVAVAADRFPVARRFEGVLDELQKQQWECKVAKENLTRFIKWTLEQKTFGRASQESKYFPMWSKITERGLGNQTDLHPKQEGFLKWFQSHYERCEAKWFDEKYRDDFSFKVLVYVHHRETAFDFRTHRARSEDEARLLGRKLNSLLKGLIRKTCTKISRNRKNKELFLASNWRTPSTALAAAIQGEGFLVEELIEKNLTLFLAACVNAHRAKQGSKIRSFRETISGLSEVKRHEKHFYALNTWPELRKHILERLNLEEIWEFDVSQARIKTKVRRLSVDILDPRHIANEKVRARFNADIRFGLTALQKLRLQSAQLKNKSYATEVSRIFDTVATVYEKAFQKNEIWSELARSYARRPHRTLRQLERNAQLQAHHARSIREVAVQTGDDSKSRSSVTKRFLTPGNPMVLVLTNICTVGVDLHDYCWDVVHYTPSWTPHDLEQKTGRIDRPRNRRELMKRLALAPYNVAHKIRVHHLIWPFTYDERVLSRVHLRSQFSERLLSVKSQALIESQIEDPSEIKIGEFEPLDLGPDS